MIGSAWLIVFGMVVPLLGRRESLRVDVCSVSVYYTLESGFRPGSPGVDSTGARESCSRPRRFGNQEGLHDRVRGGVAVVTGAGRGLGRLYALELARRGARVVSNAGIQKPVPFEELTIDDWRRTLDVHLDGAFN